MPGSAAESTGAARKGTHSNGREEEDPIVSALVPDPSVLPEVRMEIGFLGKSNRSGHWRLYTSLDLREFMEIRNEDMVHTVQLDAAGAFGSGTVVWVKRDADVARTRVAVRAPRDGTVS